MHHVVFYSGGIASWATAKLAAEMYGPQRVTLLFTDTRAESPDLYRFLRESAANVGASLVEIADGRTPWEVFKDQRLIGNSRVAPCSDYLKRRPALKWMREHHPDPTRVRLHFGMYWDERHRLEIAARNWAPYELCDLLASSILVHADVMDWLSREGIRHPSDYDKGFTHANCDGLCVRAGKRHWAHVLHVNPDGFLYAEEQERQMRAYLKREDVTMLKDETLEALRRRVHAQPSLLSALDNLGSGCGCFIGAAG